MRGVIAYAPFALDCDRPWLIELDPGSGRVAAFVAPPDDGPVGARREVSRRREHTSLATACDAYRLDAARDLQLRWWRDVDLARVAEIELARRGLEGARVVRADAGLWVVGGRGLRLRIATAHDVLRWGESVAA